MGQLFSTMVGFTSKAIMLLIAGSMIALFAGEVRLAALKKASQGSTKLTKFTERMTGTKLDL